MTKFIARLVSISTLGVLAAFCLLHLAWKQPTETDKLRVKSRETRLLKDEKLGQHHLQKLSVQGQLHPGQLRVEYFDVLDENNNRGGEIRYPESHTKTREPLIKSIGQESAQRQREAVVPASAPSPAIEGNFTGEGPAKGLACDAECSRFKNLLANWPPTKPKAAIYFLTYSNRLMNLRAILSQLDQYFNDKFHYPILIFHEKDLRPHLKEIRNYSNSEVFFQEIVFKIPSFLTKPVVHNIPCTSHVTYRHMCRFHAKGIYEEPIMQDLEFAWRLDDDSELLRPVKYDVFKFMRSHQYIYGYVIKHWDAMSCTKGLWNATRAFIEEYNITPTFFSKWIQPRLYYNNFEISSMKLWLSQEYKNYIGYLDRLGGMYYHRWGDAPIKGIAVSLFVTENQTYYFKDVAYRHRSMQNAVVSD